ncbi:hypothetical protein EIN_497090 [Entamoeba invadens IP1]|uniref:Uncharacterized protein n=1 Tax=Entamoeba invadens IP1 TaxID=370355 RepID=A0A0A1TZV6_ENTIV|nr:hypothetical protein EIN_497090 [Entamoeba invadens IP1]ELP87144.1 hypothetical protein EIN_497090 [Entamoeba invadens IP1]|eukprot:XP_004253915.1 hypothetical protein EIN_497090 [Entamoeba invadens IP1]
MESQVFSDKISSSSLSEEDKILILQNNFIPLGLFTKLLRFLRLLLKFNQFKDNEGLVQSTESVRVFCTHVSVSNIEITRLHKVVEPSEFSDSELEKEIEKEERAVASAQKSFKNKPLPSLPDVIKRMEQRKLPAVPVQPSGSPISSPEIQRRQLPLLPSELSPHKRQGKTTKSESEDQNIGFVENKHLVLPETSSIPSEEASVRKKKSSFKRGRTPLRERPLPPLPLTDRKQRSPTGVRNDYENLDSDGDKETQYSAVKTKTQERDRSPSPQPASETSDNSSPERKSSGTDSEASLKIYTIQKPQEKEKEQTTGVSQTPSQTPTESTDERDIQRSPQRSRSPSTERK